jgi:hypothetical protein
MEKVINSEMRKLREKKEKRISEIEIDKRIELKDHLLRIASNLEYLPFH